MTDPLRKLAACSLCLAAHGVAGAGGQWTIVATYPLPEGASGLAYDGTWLYCGIYGPNGGEVYRIDPDTGAVALLFTGPKEDAFGLTYDGQYLWTTDHPGGSTTPAVAMQLDWSGALIGQFDLPAHYVSGIAFDNGDFWVARYYPDPSHLFKIDAAGAAIDDFTAPDDQPWDLCIENGNLWMADYWGDTLYRINTTTGTVIESHGSYGTDPAGVVWDDEFLWYCDNGEGGQDRLYKVWLDGPGTPLIDIPTTAHDFGAVPIGESASWPMSVHNVGDAPLVVTGITFNPPDDLSSTALFPVTVPIGMTIQFPIVYTPTTDGPLAATGTVSSNDPVHPTQAVTLTGQAVFPVATIEILDDTHDFGAVRINAHTRWFVQITNLGNAVLSINDLQLSDSHFYLDDGVSLPIDVDTSESVQIGVWFNPDSTALFGATLDVYSNDPSQNPATVTLAGSGNDAAAPIGQSLWSYTIDVDFDNSPKAMASIPDISGDGVADVIVCSEDGFVRCFNGNAHGTGDVLWEHEIFAGSVYDQKDVQIVADIDDDGYHDVVIGVAWGGRLIRALSGKTGQEIWTHDTHEYGGGGWVYQVDCSYDYNGDGTVDVLAATGDDSTDTGPKRVYCLDGLNGLSIWERPLGGPVFGVIGVADFTGDGVPDAVAGASNAGETQGRAVGIDGADGTEVWSFPVGGSSVWALAQIDDITIDGIPDVIIGDFAGQVFGLDATDGGQRYTAGGLGLLTRFETLDDVNGDGKRDIAPAHLGTFARIISGRNGDAVWTTALADKPAVVSRIADVNGDGINDLIVGTLFTNNLTYFLDGTDGSILQSANYGQPVDAITAIPDVTGDGSWEVIVGGRNGLVTCLSGGLAVPACPLDCGDGDGTVGIVDFLALLAQWGTPGTCDADGGGVGITDFLELLANWGPCP